MEGIKVLLVDDEVEFTASMRRVLARRGFEVDVADGGLAALPMMTQKRFDVVVLDIKMPGMDGIRVLAEIKRRYPSTQVIMLTGHFSFDGEEDPSQPGAFAHLLKPIPIMKLVDIIRDAAVHGKTITDGGASP
jgi:two-component system, OmpR family, response regulator